MTLCISAGELNHLPALFTCHLSDVIAGRRFEETHSPVLLPIARINPHFFFLGQGYPTNHFHISLASRS